jgi:hypothetical protein
MLEDVLDDEVAESVPAEHIRPAKNFIHKLSCLLVREVLEEPFQHAATTATLGGRDRMALQLFYDEFHTIIRHGGDALLQHEVSMRRRGGLHDMASQLIHQCGLSLRISNINHFLHYTAACMFGCQRPSTMDKLLNQCTPLNGVRL